MDDLSDLNKEERDELEGWAAHFEFKYPIVGWLVEEEVLGEELKGGQVEGGEKKKERRKEEVRELKEAMEMNKEINSPTFQPPT